MPRLSIIVPHRGSDARLEATLLSLLENRPQDSEIIVAHDGSYQDPYDLADELIFIEEAPGSATTELLNAGLMAACAPSICVMLDGTQVEGEWAEKALEALECSPADSVAIGVVDGQRSTSYGVSAKSLDRLSDMAANRLLLRRQSGVAGGPILACGFYRRRVLLAFDGWDRELGVETAEVDLAYAMREAGLRCATIGRAEMIEGGVKVEAVPVDPELQRANRRDLASLAVAYGVTDGGLAAAGQGAVQLLLTGGFGLAMAWIAGLQDSSRRERLQKRMSLAKERLASHAQPDPRIHRFPTESRLEPADARRAA